MPEDILSSGLTGAGNQPVDIQVDATEGVPGATSPAKASLVGGTDGTNLRTITTDAAGNQVVVGPPTSQTDGLRPVVIEGLEGSTFRDEFPGAALSSTLWTSVANTGMTQTITGSNLQIVTSTQSGNYYEIISVAQFRPPCRLYINLASISQRIANQEFSVEFVEVGSAQDGGNNRVGIFFDSASATQMSVRTWSQGDTGNQIVSQTISTSTAGASVFELDFTPEEVWAYQASADSAVGRSQSFRLSRKVPDPSKMYVVRIRAKNTAVVTTTTFALDSVLVENYTHNVSEVARSRGGNSSGESIPVYPAVNFPATLAGGATTGADGTANTSLQAATVGYPSYFNNSTWDRVHSPFNQSGLASAARTVLTSSADLTNHNFSAVQVILVITIASGTGGLTLRIEGKDSGVTNNYYQLNAAPTAVITTGTFVYELGLGCDGVATGSVLQRTSGALPRLFRVTVNVGDASSYTYSVGVNLLSM